MKVKSLGMVSLVCCLLFLGPVGILADTTESEEQKVALQDVAAKKIDDWFPDDNLAEEMRKLLNKSSTSDVVSQEELNAIRDVSFVKKEIHDLTGMENLHSLYTCDLSNNPITDIRPLMNLQDLWYLKLDGTDVTDLSAFLTADLPLLINLYLNNIGHIDLINLKNLPQLGVLQVKGDQLTDLDEMKELPQLYSLWAEGNQITDITGLANQTNLNFLYLDANQISDIQPLAGMSKLRHLSLTENQITDISPLGNLPSLISYNAVNQYVVNSPLVAIPSQPFTVENQIVSFDGSVLAPIDVYPTAYTYEEPNLSWAFTDIEYESSVYYVGQESTAKGEFLVVVDQPLIHDFEQPVITADPEITYTLGEQVDQPTFLKDIHASTSDGSEITSDFTEQVDFQKEGDYLVTLNATDDSGNVAEPVTVIVHIVKDATPIDGGGDDPDDNNQPDGGDEPNDNSQTDGTDQNDNSQTDGTEQNDSGQNQPKENANTTGSSLQVTQNDSGQEKAQLQEADTLPKTGDASDFGWMVAGGLLILLGSYGLLKKRSRTN
ncbi:LapB repeat-containing protein [Listeria costaricensis]|uniref:LapB repeat-containing protein n=1 Tax=Listeria costaricensis TaxID=2026604 RepID=UPI0013C4CD0F|nr:LapB repeat-containing protein [Listeria costaricensis]